MAENNKYNNDPKTLNPISGSHTFLDFQSDSDNDADFADAMLCVLGSRMIQSGFSNANCKDDCVIFVNAGGGSINEERNSKIEVQPDSCFEGGNFLRTDEVVIEGGDIPAIYQSARFGNFRYQFSHLAPGYYFIDLDFAEIVNTNGPKGIRVFNVFIQEEKVISELDIYAIVGANKPLQVVDIRVSVGDDGAISMRFEGVCGSPIVSGICIRRAKYLPASQVVHEYLICNICATEIEYPSTQINHVRKSVVKYERKIEELKTQCQLKADECYEAWMSLTAANERLQKVRMELDNKFFQNLRLEQAMEKQTAILKDVSSQFECSKRLWAEAIGKLERKIKIMKEEHSQLSHEAHKCGDSIPELNKMVSAVQALVAQCDDLKLKFSEEQEKRKKLYNQLQEAKGNVRVFCRCRPFNKEEASSGYVTVVDFTAAKDGDLGILTGGSTKRTFKFDRVYTPKDNQVEVFEDASPVVISVLDGYNVCIFAYGQTGTGKTFTMVGTEQNRGVNYRTLEQLFTTAEERKETFAYSVSVSVLEVYNEQIRDLLATSPTSKRLQIRQASEGVHHVPGIVEAKVENIKEVWDVLQAGSSARAVGSNNVNEHSSRSHCMLCILVRAKNLINGECTKSKLWLVDLAGSERLSKTEVRGERLKEAQNINKSLAALGDVISALAIKSSHIPYRNSKLTHLLQDSLGGESKTLMFVQISPSEQDLGETLSSLNFATRVRKVELGPAKKQIDTGELQKLKMMLDKAKQESRAKDDALRKLEENIRYIEGKAKGKDQLCKSLEEKVNELEDQFFSKTELCRQFERQLVQLSEGLKGKEDICSSLQQKAEELENKLREREQVDSVVLQHKIKELENRLKEKTEEDELHSGMLQLKIKELENKLMVERSNLGSQLVQRKIKELEEKLRQQEHQEYASPLYYAERFGATPNDTKASRMESMCDMDPQSDRSLNSRNRTGNMGSDLLKRTDSLRELRRKRQIQGKGEENNYMLSASLLERKILPDESDKERHNNPSKALARITRSKKPGVRESKNKLKVWLR
ncbi:Kinesin domain-containing protein/Malectin domain-containing protein [Cephalotus follicularis]|uniref:Kinesin domain-containing protein/Malectin domain-containing protein n=1 Tax=Cephalotus follicularis TaxID=3775 RepID=A0A1Q3BGG6_CEPFO|nr:Kinesin domain-containing protein/Malectin domain-containing protein [Cephalotus follicularis]